MDKLINQATQDAAAEKRRVERLEREHALMKTAILDSLEKMAIAMVSCERPDLVNRLYAISVAMSPLNNVLDTLADEDE